MDRQTMVHRADRTKDSMQYHQAKGGEGIVRSFMSVKLLLLLKNFKRQHQQHIIVPSILIMRATGE
jgi:hypothetical protein